MEDLQKEHRRSKRTKAYRPARILVYDATIHQCIIHNFTSHGICLELTFEAALLPDNFEFSLDNFRTVHLCRTIWREDNVAGVVFELPPPESPERRRAKLKIVRP
jgi:hypothetical protein